MLVKMQPFMISFLIGLFIGVDRERSLPKGLKGMGVRSFIIIALLGTLAASMRDFNVAMIVSGFVLAAVLLSYFITSQIVKGGAIVGLTTTLTGGVVFCLGYIAKFDPPLTAALGGGIFILLLSRNWLHTFAHDKILPSEIRAAAALVVIFLSVIIFLPNQTIDPWGLFNPQRFGILIAVIATIQFAGYMMIRLFGDRLGIMFVGFFGGLVSSTAVFANLPMFLKGRSDRTNIAVAAGILATVGMLTEFSIIVTVAAHDLFLTVALPVAVMAIIGLLCAITLFRHKTTHQQIEEPHNPLDIKAVLYLSTIIGGMLILVAFAKNYFGTQGVQLVTLFGGIFEVHGVSLATATLYVNEQLSLVEAHRNLLLALLASFVPKFVLPWALVRGRFAIMMSGFMLLMIVAGATSILLTHSLLLKPAGLSAPATHLQDSLVPKLNSH
jgi:uncharacterized membrane protein (DUF4010 family)